MQRHDAVSGNMNKTLAGKLLTAYVHVTYMDYGTE